MKELKLNGFPILENYHYVINDEGIMFKSNIFMIYTNFYKQPSSNILSKISKSNYIKPTHKGKGLAILIKPEGLYEWICHSLSFDVNTKRILIDELKDCDLISNNLPNMSTRIELDFLSELRAFYLIYDPFIIIKHQIQISGYIVDFVINDLAIEYDEFEHKYYNKEKEVLREEMIRNEGYRVIRISNKKSNIENIALILKNINYE